MGREILVAPGVNVHVEDVGEGTPIVLLHGWPVNHRMFEYQMNWLPEHGYRVIGIDLRGYGASDKPWKGYDYDTMADDVRAVLGAMDLRDVVLGGFSMGGAIAIRYMARHDGDRVSKLALFGAAAPSFTQREGFPHNLDGATVDEFVAACRTDRPALLADFGGMFFDESTEISPKFEDWFHGLGMEAAGHSTAASLLALRDEDLRDDLGKISVPTAIFHGVNDQICSFELAEAMHAGIEGSSLTRFEKSGHGLFYDELEKFNQELRGFLDR